MNAMSTFQQLVASVDHEGLYRPWVLLLSMHLMLRPGSIRVSILHNHVSTFKSDSRQEAPLPARRFKAFFYLHKTQKIATQMKMFRLEIHYVTTESHLQKNSRKEAILRNAQIN